MSKETERLFRPGECCIILPDRSVYIFLADDPDNPPKFEYQEVFSHPIELYADNSPFHEPMIFDHYLMSLFHATPGRFIKCNSVETFSKGRNKIGKYLYRSQDTCD